MIIGKWNRSVILTYIGMVSAIFGIYFALGMQNINYAFCCLMLSGICDLFDGAVARKVKRTDEEKAFGVELDSLVDVISFIVLPIVLFCAIGFVSVYHFILYSFYAIAGIARLAYFNIDTADTQGPVKYYTGLPVTYVALIFPVIYLIRGFISGNIFAAIYPATMALIAVFEVIRIKVIKPRGIAYVFFGLLAIAMLVIYLFVL
ncbi:MAG: CDP-alcohol phosphatidyltransferase family protein [Clostridiales bacterium]|nr:CDP-alcohol phosphatidyltransferase family protein [Clostridiales bacterium]